MSWVRGDRYANGQRVDPATLAEDRGLSFDSASGLWVPRQVHPDRVEVTQPWNEVIAIVGTTAAFQSSAAFGGGIIYNAAGAQNDEFGYDLLLRKGTWSFTLTFSALNSDGIISCRLDGVEFASQDGYNVSGVRLFNGFKVQTGIVVATTGIHRVSFKAASKNASSSGYFITVQQFTFRRTGA